MFNKKTTSEEATPKTTIRRKALIWTGTAVGIIVAYAFLTKSNAGQPTSSSAEAEAEEIIRESRSAE